MPTPPTRPDQAGRAHGAILADGTDRFRIFKRGDAPVRQDRLDRRPLWTRLFSYSDHVLHPSLPHPGGWDQLRAAL